MRLSGWLGRRFGQDAVARVRNTHWGWLSLGRWVLRLRCAALLSEVVGTKARSGRVVSRRDGKGNNRMSARGERLAGDRERKRQRKKTDRLVELSGNKCKSVEVG